MFLFNEIDRFFDQEGLMIWSGRKKKENWGYPSFFSVHGQKWWDLANMAQSIDILGLLESFIMQSFFI